MNILKELRTKRLYFDGGTGTVLQSRGLAPGAGPETWNTERPQEVLALHRAYIAAGCRILKTNTFGLNPLRGAGWEDLARAGVALARQAAQEHGGIYVAYDIGPTGKLLKPFGDLDFEEAVQAFGAAARLGEQAGADLILIETMNDCAETKAAVLGAKENTSLPVFVTNAYDATGKLLTGADPVAMIAMLEGLGVDALGINCSVGPDKMLPLVEQYAAYASLPIIVNPNAGLPHTSSDGSVQYDMDATAFAEQMRRLCLAGATVLGGCCGTTPEYLAATVACTASLPYALPEKKEKTLVSSYAHALEIGPVPLLVGERINPTGKPKMKEALLRGDYDYGVDEGIRQADAGVQMLDVNVGTPGVCEAEALPAMTLALQSAVKLPLMLDTADPVAMERALRVYVGKPLINSVSGKEESLRSILPLAKKYGGVLIALAMDDNGIPPTAAGRLAVIRKILRRARALGIRHCDIVADPLCLAVSAQPDGATVTLQAVSDIKNRLGLSTSLGVSNVSFGLPRREILNRTFFAMALANGLSLAIMNPFAPGMLEAYRAGCALTAKDEQCTGYISYATSLQEPLPAQTTTPAAQAPVPRQPGTQQTGKGELYDAVLKGTPGPASQAAQVALDAGTAPLAVMEQQILPALEEVGRRFEAGRFFLPQLLMSAQAATEALQRVRATLPKAHTDSGRIMILATVKGDIHDIGKNIVRALLESFGFRCLDLGRDVPPQEILKCAVESGCRLVGLSALMTTTLPAMQQTVELLRAHLPDVKIVVGGAVLTASYAASIGADCYAKDAMDTVRFAQHYYASGRDA